MLIDERRRVYDDMRAVYARLVTDDQLAARFTPRDYQVEMIEYLRANKRALCYDLVGAGKTLEASEAAAPYGPTLIAAPGYLCEQWYDFLRMQYPGDIVVHAGEGPRAQREEALTLPYDWMIVTHEMVRKHADPAEQKAQIHRGERTKVLESYELMDKLWWKPRTVIVDEFHHFRGRGSAQSKGLLEISKDPAVDRMIGLTATPVYRQGDDLFMQCKILRPTDPQFSSYYGFVYKHFTVYNNGFKQEVVKPKSQEAFEQFLASIGMGRSYAQIGMLLPKLITMPIVKIDFTPQESKAYKTLRDNYRKTLIGEDGSITTIPLEFAGAVLHELRRMTLTPTKLAAIKDICDSTEAGPNPNMVVFCWYRDTASAIAEALGPERADLITGDMPPAERAALAKSTKHPIKVVTIAALSEGVDLSHMSTIIYAEEDYAPGAMFQATGRVRRNPDSPYPVVLYYIHVKNSVDEVVHSAVQHRLSSVGQIVRQAIRGDD